MKRQILLLVVLTSFLWACTRPHGGCNTCPTFDKKSYKKKLRSNR